MFWKVVAPLLALCLAVASAGMPGAPVDADLNEEGVRDALRFAVAQHNRASNDMFIRQVSKVIRVQKQIVSGMKYIFTVEMSRTGCRKGGVKKVCAIKLDPNTAQSQTCKFSVWSQPWLKSIKLVETTCQKSTGQ